MAARIELENGEGDAGRHVELDGEYARLAVSSYKEPSQILLKSHICGKRRETYSVRATAGPAEAINWSKMTGRQKKRNSAQANDISFVAIAKEQSHLSKHPCHRSKQIEHFHRGSHFHYMSNFGD